MPLIISHLPPRQRFPLDVTSPLPSQVKGSTPTNQTKNGPPKQEAPVRNEPTPEKRKEADGK